jgi:hypothetical protein
MAIRIQLRRDTAANWTSSNPVLRAGELGIETDTLKFKIGNGSSTWTQITNYANVTSTGLSNSLNDYILAADQGTPGGPAELDSNGDLLIPENSIILWDDADYTFTTTLTATQPTANRTITFPDATTTVVGTDTTNTLTNKSISLGSNTVTATLAQLNTAVSDADLASLSGTETLTNKTLTSPVISTITNTGTVTIPSSTDTLVGRATTDTLTNKSISLGTNTVTATLAQLNTAITDADVASLTGTETLTNKTLTSPVISGLTISDASIVIEGATADDFETTITFADATADRTITFPNNSGTVAFTADISAATGGSVSETGTQTLTNKTLSLSSNTITGTLAEFNTALTDANFAPIDAPTFTGIPAAPTATVGTDTTQIATTAFVQDAIEAVVGAAPSALNTLSELADALNDDANFSSTVTNSLALKAPLASPTFTGTVSGITSTMVGLGNVDNTSDANKPVSTATQTALDLKLNLTDPAVDYYITNSGSGAYLVNGVSNGNIYFEKGKKYRIHVNASGHPFWIQTVSGAYSSGDVYSTGITNNGAQSGHIIVELPSNAPQLYYACQYHSSMAGSVITGTTFATYKALADLSNVNNTSDANKPVSTATQTALDLKANLASPTFTGTVSGITATMVGLGNVDNTSDANKPVSTATQTALDLKVDESLFDAKGDLLVASADNTPAKLSVGTNGYLLTANSSATNGVEWAAAPVSLPSQTGNSGYYLTTDGTNASWGALVVPITTGTATVTANTATTVDTTALSGFTSIEYMVSLKQGSKVRTSKVVLQTDGTSVDMTEFAITETGGTIAGVVVSAAVSSTNGVLQVTATDAATTNVTVKFSKVAL